MCPITFARPQTLRTSALSASFLTVVMLKVFDDLFMMIGRIQANFAAYSVNNSIFFAMLINDGGVPFSSFNLYRVFFCLNGTSRNREVKSFDLRKALLTATKYRYSELRPILKAG